MSQSIIGDVVDAGLKSELDLSVVCPFYNEEQIIEGSILALVEQLGQINASWELIVVDDGSRDASSEYARKLAKEYPNVRYLGYGFNRGRGHALRTGIEQARGAIIVTTEIDLSWGDDIIDRLYREACEHPDTDIIVASPHLPDGAYKNVPLRRVLYSQVGNHVIRTCMMNAVTMNTGMTRAYKRKAIRALPLEEDGKEFHLEVILKARGFNYSIREIPAILEWKEHKHQGGKVVRKSSSKINKLIVSHSLFSLFANPIRYVWGLGVVAAAFSFGFLAVGVVRYAMELVSVYSLIVSLAFAILSLILFGFGVIAQQGNMVQRELWRMRRDMWEQSQARTEEPIDYGYEV